MRELAQVGTQSSGGKAAERQPCLGIEACPVGRKNAGLSRLRYWQVLLRG